MTYSVRNGYYEHRSCRNVTARNNRKIKKHLDPDVPFKRFTHPTIGVQRGVLGSREATHSDGAEARVYRGAFNIVGNDIHFIDPPKGNTRARRNESNLPYVKAEFSGRTFLRSNYEKNMLFDDISDSFTGVGKTYTLTTSGLNTTGVGIGS